MRNSANARSSFCASREKEDLAWEVEVRAYIEQHPGSPQTIKQHLAAIKMLFDYLVISQIVPTNPAAPAVSEQWHTERYADNDTEFDKWGGNTGIREEFETEQWSGQFKCKACGKPITDGYRIQGILHHGCDLECEACAQTGQI